jgi:hypothetical protein
LKGLFGNQRSGGTIVSIARERERVKEYIDRLSPERLQVAAEFLAFLLEKENQDSEKQNLESPGISAWDLVKDLIGSAEGPPDLSTNREYLQGFGES